MRARRSPGWHRTIPLTVAATAAVALGLATSAPASAATAPSTQLAKPLASTGISGWTQTTHYLESTLTAGEGVATVTPPGGSSSVLYRGAGSIPIALDAAGWTHIGDPDSTNGYIFDAYQNSSSSSTTKMYLVTTPSGSTYQYTHTLVSGEVYNNSFDAVSPDTQWLISGEWGTMSHIQIYPTPVLNHATSATGGTLRLSGYIQLDHAVNDIQGCDFTSATNLICASDDSSDTLFSNPKPLLDIQLPSALNGANETGHVIDLGSIPQTNSICSGTFESEGVDYDPASGILRVEIIQPSVCEVATTVFEYKAS
ncbi:MAG TPA: hypothetical protein VGX23_11630 [Actinocrinis sp.]|nr:hypothetical protein [Actinocrinis sp.]